MEAMHKGDDELMKEITIMDELEIQLLAESDLLNDLAPVGFEREGE